MTQLSTEKAVQKDIKAGREADAKGQTIGATFVRRLVLEADAPSGVRIRGARIVGPLDLQNARGAAGEPCKALVLTNCDLVGSGDPAAPGLDARHANIQRLALIDCQTDGVELSSAMILGDLVLDGLRPRRERGEGAACWVKARDIRIDGAVTARNAKLSLPWAPESAWPPSDDRMWSLLRQPWALDLRNAQIHGWVVLMPGFSAKGGLNIAGTTIGGDLWADGADLSAAGISSDSVEALSGAYAHINGYVSLAYDPESTTDGRFRAHGTINLYGARIGGTLALLGAKVSGAAGAAADRHFALDLYSASLSKDLFLQPPDEARMPCEIRSIRLRGATIGGQLYVSGSLGTPFENIDAIGVRIRGDLKLEGSVARADLSGAIVDGNLILGENEALRLISIEGGQTEDDSSVEQIHPSGASLIDAQLTLGDARIGGDFKVHRITTGTKRRAWERVPTRVRSRAMTCYPGWRLAQASLRPTSGAGVPVIAFLYRQGEGVNGRPRVVILDGSSSPIHALNDEHGLRLDDRAKVEEYLTFFFHHVWGSEGAFAFTTGTVIVNRDAPTEAWHATAEATYGSTVLQAKFEIPPSGAIRMLDVEPLREVPDIPLVRFDPPVRWYTVRPSAPDDLPAWPALPPVGSPQEWSEEAADSLRSWGDDVAMVPERTDWPSGWKRPLIDLAGLKAASLEDNDGQAWFEDRDWFDDGHFNSAKPWDPTIQLILGGLEYDRTGASVGAFKPGVTRGPPVAKPRLTAGRRLLSMMRQLGTRLTQLPVRSFYSGEAWRRTLRHWFTWPNSSALMLKSRRNWLKAQYEKPDRPHPDAYNPQPYQQLAKVLRGSGYFAAADDITHDKLELEHVVMPSNPISRWLWKWFVQVPFGYGLRTRRAAVTFGLVWLLGVVALAGVPMLSIVGLSVEPPLRLTLDTSAVATVVTNEGGNDRVLVEVVDVPQTSQPREEVLCGDQINPLVYPLDVMIPLIDLRQETRCSVSFKEPWWGVAKGFYAIAGWIVTSGLILTVSGVVRRQVEK